MPHFMKISDEDLRKLHAADVKNSDIMRYYDVKHPDTIRVRQRDMGLPPRRPGGRPLGTPSVEEVLFGTSSIGKGE